MSISPTGNMNLSYTVGKVNVPQTISVNIAGGLDTSPAIEELMAEMPSDEVDISVPGSRKKRSDETEVTEESEKSGAAEPKSNINYKNQLMNDVRRNARQGNDFDEDAILRYMMKRPQVNERQYRLASKIFAYSQYNNNFDDDSNFARVLDTPDISDNQFRILDKLVSETRYENNLNEDWAFQAVLKSSDMNKRQADVLETVVDNARRNNDIDEDQAVYEVLTHPALSTNHTKLLTHIARYARKENDFDENIAFKAVCRTSDITDEQFEMCKDIFDNAQYYNNLNDMRLFIDVLSTPAYIGVPKKKNKSL